MKDAEQNEMLMARAQSLPAAAAVEATALRLERMNWKPELLIDVPDFSRISKGRLLEELTAALDPDNLETAQALESVSMDIRRARFTQASLLMNAAELLWKLRADNPEAWDLVNELYEDD